MYMPLGLHLHLSVLSLTVKKTQISSWKKNKCCILGMKFHILVMFFSKAFQKSYLFSSGNRKHKVRELMLDVKENGKNKSRSKKKSRFRGPGSSAAVASHLAAGLLPNTKWLPLTSLLHPALEEAHIKT